MEEKTRTNSRELSVVEKAIVIFILMFIVMLMGFLEIVIQAKMGEYAMLYTAGLYAAIAGAILLYAEWDKENAERKMIERQSTEKRVNIMKH